MSEEEKNETEAGDWAKVNWQQRVGDGWDWGRSAG